MLKKIHKNNETGSTTWGSYEWFCQSTVCSTIHGELYIVILSKVYNHKIILYCPFKNKETSKGVCQTLSSPKIIAERTVTLIAQNKEES